LLSFGAESLALQSAIEKFKIKKYRTIILPVVLFGCETWSLTLREECRLRLIENRMLMRIFGPKRPKSGESYIMRSSMIYTPHPILFG